MGLILLATMVVVPIAEIAVFIRVGGSIGVGPTIAVVVITAVIGTALLRLQGLATLVKARESLARNRLPLREVFDGLCLVLAGALLLTPGFITDTAGLLLFVPPVRSLLAEAARRYLATHGQFTVHGSAAADPPGSGTRHGSAPGPVIEGEYEDLGADEEPPADSRRPRPPRPR